MRPTPDHRQTVGAGASSVAVSVSWQAAARRLLAATAGVALVAGLAGCVNGTPSGDQTGAAEPATAPTSTASSGAAAETGHAAPLADTSGGASASAAESAATEAAATETVRQTVTDALSRLAAGTPKPATAQVSDALTGAGIAPGVLQVSQSRTPTGLEADAIESAVLQGSDCVIGQVRDGAVAVTVLPVLASGKCFVGS